MPTKDRSTGWRTPKRAGERGVPESPDAHVLMEWPTSNSEVLRVAVRKYRAITLIDIRRFYADLSGTLRPGKGISLTKQNAQRVRRGLRKAINLLEAENV